MKRLSSDVKAPDDDAWSEAVKGVKKLPEVEAAPQAPLIIEEVNRHIDYQTVYQGEKLENLEAGSFANIDKKTAEKFKRGEFPIQRTLDLHGVTEKTAFEEVGNFIKNSYMSGLRCVLIITGKGRHSENDLWFESRGVLKEKVPQWLNHEDLRPLILGFNYALPADGGDGALAILLRRHRSK